MERGWQFVEGKSEAAVGSGSGSGSDWRSLSSPTNCALDPAHQPEAFKTEKAPPSTSIKCNVRNAAKAPAVAHSTSSRSSALKGPTLMQKGRMLLSLKETREVASS